MGRLKGRKSENERLLSEAQILSFHPLGPHFGTGSKKSKNLKFYLSDGGKGKID